MAPWTSIVGAAQLARLLASHGAGADGNRARTSAPAGATRKRSPAYRRLADGIRLLLLEGRIPVAARLPAERELAAALEVSRTTVATAFESLRAEGFLASRRGAGSWTAVPAGSPPPTGGLEPLPPEAADTMIDLGSAALPAPEPHLTRAFERALGELPPYAHTHGDYPAGLPVLRRAVAEHYSARGVPTMPEQIMITTGAMGAVTAVSRLFVSRGERIAVEHPSYANILRLLRESGSRLVPVPMAEGLAGWDMSAWRQVLRESAPRMAYVMADFHNPTGALVDDNQRRDIVAAARGSGTVMVADETMTELALDPDTPRPRPMAAFDSGGSSVITVGSVSKTVWAGMRIGWIRATPEVVRGLTQARAHADLGSPVLEQLAVAHLLAGGSWQETVALHRARARENRDALVSALRLLLPAWTFTVPTGGLTLWARTGGLSSSRVAEAADRLGVRVPSGPRFGLDGAFESFVRLPFTLADPLATEAVTRLASAAELVGTGAATVGGAPRSHVA